jgi:hypothetical protein
LQPLSPPLRPLRSLPPLMSMDQTVKVTLTIEPITTYPELESASPKLEPVKSASLTTGLPLATRDTSRMVD